MYSRYSYLCCSFFSSALPMDESLENFSRYLAGTGRVSILVRLMSRKEKTARDLKRESSAYGSLNTTEVLNAVPLGYETFGTCALMSSERVKFSPESAPCSELSRIWSPWHWAHSALPTAAVLRSCLSTSSLAAVALSCRVSVWMPHSCRYSSQSRSTVSWEMTLVMSSFFTPGSVRRQCSTRRSISARMCTVLNCSKRSKLEWMEPPCVVSTETIPRSTVPAVTALKRSSKES
mmetsp:Transcript_32985/g.84220  ORF Transcript_32985/g.84220 Transcript_32985/m.84220 type:complete len:234 (+) Transcript_32985:1325-2026(+)